MKVYVVTTGSYSDYMIHQIFSTEEKAEEYIQWYYDSACKRHLKQAEEYRGYKNNRDTIKYSYMMKYEDKDFDRDIQMSEDAGNITLERFKDLFDMDIEEFELDTEYVKEDV